VAIPLISWAVAGFILYLAGAVGCVLAMIWLLRRGDAKRHDRNATIGALGLTATWCVTIAAYGAAEPIVTLAEMARNLAWILVLYRLFAVDGRHESLRPIRPVVFALAFVEILHPALLIVELRYAIAPDLQVTTFQIGALFRVLVAVGSLVLLHNLYVGASATTRRTLGWTAAALSALWAFDLNFYTTAYLGGEFSAGLVALRGLVAGAVGLVTAIGANAGTFDMRLRPSRAVAFQSLSLLVIGGYLMLMVAIAKSLNMLGGDLGPLTQVGFLLAASVAALFWLPSARLRGWLRVTLVKNFFQHRYDYRAEWLRLTQTIGQDGGQGRSLHQRVIQAIADIAESPSGRLMLPADKQQFKQVDSWNWECDQSFAHAIPADLALLLERHNFILDLDEARAGKDRHGEASLLSDWLIEDERAWALVPLLHFDRLMGVVVLARPSVPRSLDWEDFDLLRVVGQQLASYLAEQTSQSALMEAARFDEFNRRIAFVVHDIKNLASQLALLAGNAERHADKPEFRADMLVTLRNSADKLNALLARLARYNANPAKECEATELTALAKRVAERFEGARPISFTRAEPCTVMANSEALEQSLLHLVQNAVDASPPDSPVMIEIVTDGLQGVVEIIDSGDGMSAEFIRDQLFRPFASTKNGGFGIGAFEARELITAMGGRLELESREGLGSRFAIRLPLSTYVDVANDAPPPLVLPDTNYRSARKGAN